MNTPPPSTPPLSRRRVWLLAARPKTLPVAVAVVLVGTALAAADGGFHLPSALLALAAALGIQILANLVNDYADFRKGTDDEKRLGPLRVTSAGLVTPAQMRRAIAVTLALILSLSLYLVVRGGLPILLIGVLSVLSGILYTAGPFPLGYIGLGDLFVLVFFGPLAVAGTHYVQVLRFSPVAALAGVGPGLLAVAVLTVNNLRDMEGDRASGKLTLAARFGLSFARLEYLSCLIGATLVPALLLLFAPRRPLALAAAGMWLFAAAPLRAVFTRREGPVLNQALAQTGRLLLVYAALFSAGWLLSPT